MTTLKEKLTESIKNAMRSGDKPRLNILRMMAASIKQREVDTRLETDDPTALGLFDKMIKDRRESISQFLAGNRPDLIEREEYDISVIQEFMPTPLTEAEIEQFIAAAIQETGATAVKDMGKVMAIVKPQIQGRADASKVSAQIKARLS